MFIRFLLIICIGAVSQASLAAWGCQPAKIKPGNTSTGCFKQHGVKRHYRLHVPAAYPVNKQLPLLIGLHGGGGKNKRFEAYSRFSEVSDTTGAFIAVYPQGIHKYWNDGRPNVNAEVDDVGFLQQLVIHLQQTVGTPIQNHRIYLAGMSNGGLMALRMACEKPDWVAGVGVVAASMSIQLAQHCPAKPVPVTIAFIFGDQDSAFLPNRMQVNPVKPSQVRGRHIGIRRTVEQWAKINHCTSSTRSPPIDAVNQDRTRVVIERHQGCQKPVLWYDIEGGGHRWADRSAKNGFVLRNALNLGSASHEINAAETLWALFETVK